MTLAVSVRDKDFWVIPLPLRKGQQANFCLLLYVFAFFLIPYVPVSLNTNYSAALEGDPARIRFAIGFNRHASWAERDGNQPNLASDRAIYP
jgi:hypothetical protein